MCACACVGVGVALGAGALRRGPSWACGGGRCESGLASAESRNSGV